jgi:phenylacetate-CoA ligase
MGTVRSATVDPMSDHVMFHSHADIAAAQEANFAETMDLAVARHPWCARVMARHGLGRDDFRSLADIVKLPVATKQEYMSAPDDFRLSTDGLAPEMQAGWDVMHTTGSTSGKPTPFYSTSWDFYDILTLQHAMMTLRKVDQNDIIANLFPLTMWPHGGFTRANHAAAVMNLPVIAALPGNPSPHFRWGRGLDEVVATVQRSRATILWGVTSYIRRVLVRAAELGADFSPVRLVLVTGEAAPEGLRRDLVARLETIGARSPFVSISYGATEMQGGMVECAPGSGYHNPVPDQFYVEIVDPDTHEPVPDGAPGLILLTHLRRRGTLLLRYALGDITRRTRETCPHCGANTDRLTEIPRRVDALVKIRGMLVNPDLISEILAAESSVAEFQIVIDRVDPDDRHSMDRMRLRIAFAGNRTADDAVAARLAERVKQAVGVAPIIETVARAEILGTDDSLKSKRMIDLRPAAD